MRGVGQRVERRIERSLYDGHNKIHRMAYKTCLAVVAV